MLYEYFLKLTNVIEVNTEDKTIKLLDSQYNVLAT